MPCSDGILQHQRSDRPGRIPRPAILPLPARTCLCLPRRGQAGMPCSDGILQHQRSDRPGRIPRPAILPLPARTCLLLGSGLNSLPVAGIRGARLARSAPVHKSSGLNSYNAAGCRAALLGSGLNSLPVAGIRGARLARSAPVHKSSGLNSSPAPMFEDSWQYLKSEEGHLPGRGTPKMLAIPESDRRQEAPRSPAPMFEDSWQYLKSEEGHLPGRGTPKMLAIPERRPHSRRRTDRTCRTDPLAGRRQCAPEPASQ